MLSGRTFPYRGNTTNGIFNYFYENNNSKYLELVKVNASARNERAKYALDFTNNYWNAGTVSSGSYIIFYLRDYFVKLRGYSLTTSNLDPGTRICHPKNWGFDASNDMVNWHHQVNITDTEEIMNHKGASNYFSWSHGIYRYFRVMNTGIQHGGYGLYSIDLLHFELFGTLLVPNLKTCNNQKKLPLVSLSFIIILTLST